MLTRKTVSIHKEQMLLWNEAGNFVSAYDIVTDGEMCSFLRTMIEQDIYRLIDRSGAMSLRLAA